MAGFATFLPYIVNGGVALVVMCLIIVKMLVPGWLYQEKQEELKELKQALEHERDRSDAAVAAAAATRDILLSLRGRYAETPVQAKEDKPRIRRGERTTSA